MKNTERELRIKIIRRLLGERLYLHVGHTTYHDGTLFVTLPYMYDSAITRDTIGDAGELFAKYDSDSFKKSVEKLTTQQGIARP